MEEALKLLAKAGIDIEDLKRKIASGEWMVVEGDSECVLDVVSVTRHSAILLFVAGGEALCLVKKTEAFVEATGLDEEALRRIVWIHVKSVPTGCSAAAHIEKSVEEAADEIARALVKAAEKALELTKRPKQEGGPDYVQ
jgi:hypothetical protein